FDSGSTGYGSPLRGGAPGAERSPRLPGGPLPFPPPAAGSGPQPEADRWPSLSDHRPFRNRGGAHCAVNPVPLAGGPAFGPPLLVWFHAGWHDPALRIP